MSRIITINETQTKGVADVSKYNRHLKIKAAEPQWEQLDALGVSIRKGIKEIENQNSK